MKKRQVLLQRSYSWDSAPDAERDVSECVEDLNDNNDKEWMGTIILTVEYEERKNK